MKTAILMILKQLGTDLLLDLLKALIRLLQERPDTTVGKQSVREVDAIVKRNKK